MDDLQLDGQKLILFSKTFRLAPGTTQPPKQWVPGALEPQGKATDRSYTSVPPYAFTALNTFCTTCRSSTNHTLQVSALIFYNKLEHLYKT